MITDGLWTRITDLPTALSLRRYACPVDVVLDVHDELFPDENAGQWRLRVGRVRFGGLRARGRGPRTCLGITELGAAYLGGTRLGALAAAGRVTQHRTGALAQLSAAMSWDPAPWCPVIF